MSKEELQKVKTYKVYKAGFQSWVVEDESGEEVLCVSRQSLDEEENGYTYDQLLEKLKSKYGENIEIIFSGSSF